MPCEYTLDQCRVCWLYWNDATARGHWNDVKVVFARPDVQPAKWGLVARGVAMLRHEADVGLGDTIARNLQRFGADGMKRLYRRITGADCGCGDRQVALNRMYPYA